MSTYSRDQFKATGVSSLKKQKVKEDAVVGSSGGRTDYVEIANGMNRIRIAPAFPGEEQFYHMRTVHWCSVEKADGELGRITVPNSRIHGGTKLDIFEEYIKFVKENLKGKDAQEKIKKLTDWKGGLMPSTTWQAYAWKIVKDQKPKFGIFEFKKSVRDELNTLCIVEDDEEAIETDPFTDPEDGKCVLLTYDSSAKKAADYYKLQLSKNATPLTDEMFDELLSKKPLSELLGSDTYTMVDFEKALEGVRNFDIENEIDLFDEDEFQEIVEMVKAQYDGKKSKSVDSEDSEKSTKKESSKVETKKSSKNIVEEEEEEEEEDVKDEEGEDGEEGDKFSSMDRSQLKEYKAKKGYDFKIFTTTSDDDLRDKLRSLESKTTDTEAEEEEEEEEENHETPKVEKKVDKKVSEDKPQPEKKKLTLAELKEKMKNKS